MDKEIINNNIESQALKEKDEQVNNQNEPENLEIKGNLNSKKIILKKNVRQLKAPNQDNNDNNNIPNEEIPNVEIEIKNDNEEYDYNDLLINNDDEEIKVENPSNNMEEKNNELEKSENKEKGYLDDDLEDEDNKKLYLRVVKRLEKTYGVPIITANIPGEKIEDIGIEENIRPILFNNKNIGQKKVVNNQQNLNYKNNNKENIINNIQNIQVNQNKSNNKNPYNNKNNIITYEYNINNNQPKGMKQYINNPINFNKPPIYPNKNVNNIINNSQKYTNKYPINNRTPQYRYNFQSSQKYNNNRPRTNNMYLSKYINKKLNANKTPIVNNHKKKYSYENPFNNLQRNKKEMPRPNNKNNNNTRYQGYLNNNLGKKENKNNYMPISNINYYNIGNTKSMLGDIPKVNPQRFNNYNIMRKTYDVLSNQKKAPNALKGNQKNDINYNKNKYNYTLQSLSLMPNRSPIIPKRSNIPYNYNSTNILKNNRISYTTSFVANKQNNNAKNIPKSPNVNIPINKSQNILNIKNYNIGFSGNNNYGRNNVRNYSYNPLARSLNVNNINSRKILNNSNFKSLQNYQINFNCSNFNNSYGNRSQIPQGRTYVTYCIDSTYY